MFTRPPFDTPIGTRLKALVQWQMIGRQHELCTAAGRLMPMTRARTISVPRSVIVAGRAIVSSTIMRAQDKCKYIIVYSLQRRHDDDSEYLIGGADLQRSQEKEARTNYWPLLHNARPYVYQVTCKEALASKLRK